MPAIALPPQTRPRPLTAETRSRDLALAAGRGPRSRAEALRGLLAGAVVAVQRRSLTRRLACGADPAASPALALRARQLTSDRSRRGLSRALRGAVSDAYHPTPSRFPVGLIRRGAVIDAEHAIDLLVKRLRSPVPITAEGAAMVERMLSDGGWSPMYSPAGPGALRWLVVVATAALEPTAI